MAKSTTTRRTRKSASQKISPAQASSAVQPAKPEQSEAKKGSGKKRPNYFKNAEGKVAHGLTEAVPSGFEFGKGVVIVRQQYSSQKPWLWFEHLAAKHQWESEQYAAKAADAKAHPEKYTPAKKKSATVAQLKAKVAEREAVAIKALMGTGLTKEQAEAAIAAATTE